MSLVVYRGFVVGMLVAIWVSMFLQAERLRDEVQERMLEVVMYDCYIKTAVLPKAAHGWDPEVQLSMICRRELTTTNDNIISEPPEMYVAPPLEPPKTEGT